MGYGHPPPVGSAQTMYDPPSTRLSYYNQPPPGTVPGQYPGFMVFPTPPVPPPKPPHEPAPAAEIHDDNLSKRRGQRVDDLEEKLNILQKELEQNDVVHRGRMEKLLEEQLAKEAARRAKEEAELVAHLAKEEVQLAARHSKEEPELAASKNQNKDTVDDESLDSRIVRFKDAIGRKFTFPYQQCKRWVVGFPPRPLLLAV
jgi:hypothetical protein